MGNGKAQGLLQSGRITRYRELGRSLQGQYPGFSALRARLALENFPWEGRSTFACHESQLAFLSAQQEISNIFEMMRSMAMRAGIRVGFPWAEGFRQHLGQGFPSNNLLGEVLNDLARTVET